MNPKDFETLAEALRAELPEGPQVIQGERLVWRRIALRIAKLVPARSRNGFLEASGMPGHLIPEPEPFKVKRKPHKQPVEGLAPWEIGEPPDPTMAYFVARDLAGAYRMTDAQFRRLHHRRNLSPSEGIEAHVRYLQTVKTRFRPAQAQLARRLATCLRCLHKGATWEEALRTALREHPLGVV